MARETILAVHKDGDDFEVTYGYDGTELFDVFRSTVALVLILQRNVGMPMETILADLAEFIAEGHSGFRSDLN